MQNNKRLPKTKFVWPEWIPPIELIVVAIIVVLIAVSCCYICGSDAIREDHELSERIRVCTEACWPHPYQQRGQQCYCETSLIPAELKH